jgi:hypothetical protein
VGKNQVSLPDSAIQKFDIKAFEAAISTERFRRYLDWADTDGERAVALYTLNGQLSETLYISLHMLEVVLRDRIHAVAEAMTIGNRALSWYDRPEFQLGDRQLEQLKKAKADLAAERKSLSAGNLVATLTFGYWTAFLGKPYENLWQQGLHRIARKESGGNLRRKDFSTPLMRLRMLRNRIAHHEPILHWDLPKHHASMIELISWLSPVCREWTLKHCRFSSVYPPGGVQLEVRALPAPFPPS